MTYLTGPDCIKQIHELAKKWPGESVEIRRAHETLCYVFEAYADTKAKRDIAIAYKGGILKPGIVSKPNGYFRVAVEHENPGLKPNA